MKQLFILLCAVISISASAANPVLKDYKGFFRADIPGAEVYKGLKVDCPKGKVTATTIGNNKVSVHYSSATTAFSVRGSFDGVNVVIEKQHSTVKGMSGVENTAYATLKEGNLIGYGWQSVPRNHPWYRYFGDNKVCQGTYELREVPRY